MKWVLIAAGGALGSLARYWFQGAVYTAANIGFPVGTVVVNVVGCFCIGFLTGIFRSPIAMREEIRIGLTVGLLGGFTTFSAFGLETFLLAQEGQSWLALLNVTLSCVLGLAAVWCGYRLAQLCFGVA
jgi:fluoride exporter